MERNPNLKGTAIIDKRLKVVLGILLIIFVLNISTLILLEEQNLLDAIYFIVITISTVGYGDITPTHPVSKILLILLILSTLTILATLSEFIVARVIARRQLRLYLPSEGISLTKHVVIANINPLSIHMARLIQSRFMNEVVIDPDERKVEELRADGIVAYVANINNREDIKKLNLEEADVMFLFLETNEELLKSSIIIRTVDESTPIYAFTTETELEQEFAQQVGINRVYSYPRLIGSFISVMTRSVDIAIVGDQPSRNAYYYYIIASSPHHENLHEIVGDHLIIGIYNSTLLGFYNRNTEEYKQYSNQISSQAKDQMNTFAYMAIFPKANSDKIEDFSGRFDTEQIDIESRYHHVIIFGFDELVQSMIQHLRVPPDRFIVVTFNQDEFQASIDTKLETILILDIEHLRDFISERVHDDDVVINLLGNLEKALRVTLEIRKQKEGIPIHQLVNSQYEADVFRKFKVQGFINPDLLVTRSMIQYFLRYHHHSLSSIYKGSHGFEYIVTSDSPILGKRLQDLIDNNYEVLLHRRKFNANDLNDPLVSSNNEIIKIGDVLLLVKKFS